MINVVRAAYHALAAILGGAQSLHVDSYDEAYSVPSEEASILSLRTQQIIQAETMVTQVVDPLGGSFYVEALTNEIERRILDEVDEIEKMGGLLEAVERGWLHSKIATHIRHEQNMIEEGEIKIVAHNYLRDPNLKQLDINVNEFSEELRERMVAKLQRLRQQRDNEKVSNCLNALKEAGKRGENVTPYCLDAVRADATLGEMRRAFVEAFGSWKPPVYV